MVDDLDQWLAASNQAIQSAQMIGSSLESRTARDFSREMYERNLKDNRENWQLQQAYNTPAMQMQRLKMAGLNPAMMMQGGADLGMAGSSVQAAGVSSPSFAPISNAPQYDIVGAAQADLMHAQADLASAEAAESRSRVPVHVQEALSFEKSIQHTDQLIEESKQNVELMQIKSYATLVDCSASFSKTMQEISNLEKEGELTQKEIDHYEEKLASDLAVAKAQVNSLNADAAYKRQVVKQIQQAIEQGAVEFAAEYGRTEKEISDNLDRILANASKELDIQSQELARAGKKSYRNWKHFAEIWNDLLGPILSGGADVSDAVSRQRAAGSKAVKKVVRG